MYYNCRAPVFSKYQEYGLISGHFPFLERRVGGGDDSACTNSIVCVVLITVAPLYIVHDIIIQYRSNLPLPSKIIYM